MRKNFKHEAIQVIRLRRNVREEVLFSALIKMGKDTILEKMDRRREHPYGGNCIVFPKDWLSAGEIKELEDGNIVIQTKGHKITDYRDAAFDTVQFVYSLWCGYRSEAYGVGAYTGGNWRD
jgi:hypothetical protein